MVYDSSPTNYSMFNQMHTSVTNKRPLWRPLMVLAVAWLALLPGIAAQADIYKFVDQNGLVHLSDQRLHSGYQLLHKAKNRRTGANLAASSLNRKKYTPLIDSLARKYRLDSALVHAVVTMESSYDPRALSKKGAVGLMQLMPATAKRYGVSDRENPEQNVTGGVRYLRDLLLRFRSVSLALAAYNAGEGAVQRYGNTIPPYPETQRYVYKVLTHYKKLKNT